MGGGAWAGGSGGGLAEEGTGERSSQLFIPQDSSTAPGRGPPPAEEPVETGQYMSMDTGWACWESGGPSPREASDLAVWGYLRSHDDMA